MNFNVIKYIAAVLASILLADCATYESKIKNSEWAYYQRWDQDNDLSLNPAEFTSSYISSNFFSRWGKNSIAVPTLCDSAFKVLDVSRDGALDSSELFSRKAYYVIGDSIPDTVPLARSGMTKAEFAERICQAQMVQRFDKAPDQVISEAEMADAMFAICDANDDAAVSTLEFYLWQVYRK